MAFAKLHTINDKEKAEELAGIWQGQSVSQWLAQRRA